MQPSATAHHLSPLPRPYPSQELCNGGSWYNRLAAKQHEATIKQHPLSLSPFPLPRPPALQELCNGGSWYDRLAAKGVFPEAKAADVTRVLLRAVHQCHSLGVVHRCG